MNKKIATLFTAFASLFCLQGCLGTLSGNAAQCETYGLSVCRLVEPANISHPVFGWKMRSGRSGAAQGAYRLKVAKRNAKGVAETVWDSGIVESGESVGIAYGGPALASAATYTWSVQIRDEQGVWLPEAAAAFETGLLAPDDWKGSAWLSAPDAREATGTEKNAGVAAPGTSWFLKDVANAKPVVDARWTVTGLGTFEVYVNGSRVERKLSDGNVQRDFLKPGFTHVKKTRHAFTYDVTPYLKTGQDAKNVFAAEVSAGWWRDKIVNYTGMKSAFRGMLLLRYADGTEARVGTDTTWLAGTLGPVKSAAIFDGETYDAREAPAWEQRGNLKPAEVNAEFAGAIVPMEGPSIRLRTDLALAPVNLYAWQGVEGATKDAHGKVKIVRQMKPGEAFKLQKGETLVVDFGQNAAAVPVFEFAAERGTELVVKPAEMLNDLNGAKSRGNDGPEGSVYRLNLRNAKAELRYMFAGQKDVERYSPRFTFFGYRYISVTATGDVQFRSVRSVPVTSIGKELETGVFETGVPDLNRLVSNIRWGMYSNYLSVPTDCPQRNERLGWTADTQVFTGAAAYNADTYGFFLKWMRDMRESQHDDGAFPSVAPCAQYGNEGNNFGWADAGVIVPWTMWRRFGDTTIIKENWAAMEKFLARIDANEYAWDGKQYTYSDWLSYEKYETSGGWGQWKDHPDAVRYRDYLAKCHWLQDARMMAEMARALGKADAAARYEAMAEKALARIREKFVEADGMLPVPFRDMQTPALFALRRGIVKKGTPAWDKTCGGLLDNIKAHGDCLQTGFLGTSILMDTLSDEAQAPEVAYTLLLQHKNPSWLYSVDQGATTIWERWNSYVKATGFGPVGMNSFNHYAYGAVLSWMYGTMAGIRPCDNAPGFKRFVLAPVPDKRVGKMSASYESAYGRIESAWEYGADGRWIWRFTIPANTSATVTPPGGTPKEYGPGRYTVTL